MALSSGGGHEISRVNVHKDGQDSERYVVAHTTETLLMADLHTQRVSEIPWHSAWGGAWLAPCCPLARLTRLSHTPTSPSFLFSGIDGR